MTKIITHFTSKQIHTTCSRHSNVAQFQTTQQNKDDGIETMMKILLYTYVKKNENIVPRHDQTRPCKQTTQPIQTWPCKHEMNRQSWAKKNSRQLQTSHPPFEPFGKRLAVEYQMVRTMERERNPGSTNEHWWTVSRWIVYNLLALPHHDSRIHLPAGMATPIDRQFVAVEAHQGLPPMHSNINFNY